MSRLRANPEEIARDAFVKAVRVQRAYLDMTQRQLADEVGVVPSVMSTLLSNPDKITVKRLRIIIHTLNLDPLIVLAFLGYTKKEIQALQQRP